MKLKAISENQAFDERTLAELYDELEYLPIYQQMEHLQGLEKISPGVAKEISDYEERTRLKRLLTRFKQDFNRVDSPERARDASNRAKEVAHEFNRRDMADEAHEWLNKSEEYRIEYL